MAIGKRISLAWTVLFGHDSSIKSRLERELATYRVRDKLGRWKRMAYGVDK